MNLSTLKYFTNSLLLPWLSFSFKIVGTLAASIALILYTFQNKLLYFPTPPGFPVSPEDNPPGFKSPADWNTRGWRNEDSPSAFPPIPFEDAIITTVDGEKLHTWLLLQKEPKSVPTMIYFHGNAGNMGFRLHNAAEFYAKVGFNIFMIDYRGYGKSSGTPDEKGLNIDADAVLKYISMHPRLLGSKVILFGRSLGGAVALSLADRFPDLVHAIILENTFLSISAMIDVIMPLIRHLKYLLLRIEWRNDLKIQNLKQPILFVSGDSDELVPPFHMKRLFDLAFNSEGKDFYSVLGGKHNDTWYVGSSNYYARVKSFLQRTVWRSDSCLQSVNVSHDGTEEKKSHIEGSHAVPFIPTMKKSFIVS